MASSKNREFRPQTSPVRSGAAACIFASCIRRTQTIACIPNIADSTPYEYLYRNTLVHIPIDFL
eukprot:COSAG02_NODE_3974_length_5968_cov_26.913466_5_plen_64_part_00